MAADAQPLPSDHEAALATGHLRALRFGARLGELAADELAPAARAVRAAGGDPQVLVLTPAAEGLREVARWLDEGMP